MPTRHRFDHAMAEAANRQRRLRNDRIREAAIAKAEADAQAAQPAAPAPQDAPGGDDG